MAEKEEVKKFISSSELKRYLEYSIKNKFRITDSCYVLNIFDEDDTHYYFKVYNDKEHCIYHSWCLEKEFEIRNDEIDRRYKLWKRKKKLKLI
jgi:hypothetical protein